MHGAIHRTIATADDQGGDVACGCLLDFIP
jgi:hypothetical protein